MTLTDPDQYKREFESWVEAFRRKADEAAKADDPYFARRLVALDDERRARGEEPAIPDYCLDFMAQYRRPIPEGGVEGVKARRDAARDEFWRQREAVDRWEHLVARKGAIEVLEALVERELADREEQAAAKAVV